MSTYKSTIFLLKSNVLLKKHFSNRQEKEQEFYIEKQPPHKTPALKMERIYYFSSLIRILRNFTGEPWPKKPIYPFLLNNPGCS